MEDCPRKPFELLPQNEFAWQLFGIVPRLSNGFGVNLDYGSAIELIREMGYRGYDLLDQFERLGWCQGEYLKNQSKADTLKTEMAESRNGASKS